MKKILIATLATVLAASALPGLALAKRGADDPAGHVRHGGDDTRPEHHGPRHR